MTAIYDNLVFVDFFSLLLCLNTGKSAEAHVQASSSESDLACKMKLKLKIAFRLARSLCCHCSQQKIGTLSTFHYARPGERTSGRTVKCRIQMRREGKKCQRHQPFIHSYHEHFLSVLVWLINQRSRVSASYRSASSHPTRNRFYCKEITCARVTFNRLVFLFFAFLFRGSSCCAAHIRV